MPSTIDKKRIATDKSNHAAPGQPGVSPGPPPPVAGPVPTPYPYVAKSNDVKRGTTNGEALDVSGWVLLVGAVMKIVPPCNKPAIPIGIGDTVTAAKDMWGAVLSGEKDTRAKGKEIAVTGSDVALNVLFEEQRVVQVRTKFLSSVDFDAKMKDGSIHDWVKETVKPFGDPVLATSGDVVDWDFDASLPGVIPVVWQRYYVSAFRRERTPLGKGGWTHNFNQWIGGEEGRTVWRTGTGRRIPLPAVPPRGRAFVRSARIDVDALGGGGYRVRSLEDGLVRVFAPLQGGGRAVLREIRDAAGNRVELRYNEDRLAAVVDTAKRELRPRYDRKGRIVALDVWAADKVHFTVVYRYTDEGELGEVADAAGHVTRYGYDGKHRLIEKRLADGPTFRYAYDEEGERCVSAFSDEGFHPVRFDHQPSERVVTVHSTPEPRVITYDAKLAIVREATPDGAWSCAMERDEDGYVLSEKNAAGETVASAYDDRGHLIARTDEDGHTTRWEIQDDLVVKEIDARGRETRWTYDGHGDLTSVALPSGLTVSVARDRWGRVTAAYVPDGQIAAFAYDEAHNLIRETDASGGVTRYDYDDLGRLTGFADPAGRTVRVENDAIGRPILFRYEDGTTEHYTWDGRNRVTSVMDRCHRTWRLEWTGTRSIKKIVRPDGQAWQFEVDALERLVGVISPRAERYDLRYDRAGRIREEITFDGSAFARQYDRSGRVSRVELPGDAWLSYTYDPTGRVVEEDSPHGKRTFSWDETGFLLGAVLHDHDRQVAVAFERDASGRVIREVQGQRVLCFGYDRSGRLAERVLPDGTTTRYFYDLAGELVGIDHAGHKVTIQRDTSGREVRRHHHRGGLDMLRAFDPRARTIEQWVASSPGGAAAPASPVHRRWTYDAEGRVVELLDARWGRERYTYGPADELAGVEGRFGARYEYDPSGALIGAAGPGDEIPAPWRVRAGNVLLRTATHEYTYDAARRRRRAIPLGGGKPTEYLWDARSRLREVRLPSGERVLFYYDAFGRRALKMIVPRPLPLQQLGQEPPRPRVVEYLWHGFTLAAEIDSERGARVFVHNPDTMTPILHVEGGRALSYVVDAMGTPRELIDEAGRVAWAAAISPFGKVLEVYRDPAAEPASTPLRHLGHYADDETGLLCTLHRYFDPEVGRWLSIDPLLLASGGNLFGLAKSPTLAIDPFGLGHYDVQPYEYDNNGFQRHEPLQNSWLKDHGMGGRRMSDMSLGNPTIGLTRAEHNRVHRIVDGMLNGRRPGSVSADKLIDMHAQAMKAAGIPQDRIDAVVAAAKKHAPKFVCA
ncbi:DUF6531 domain-containing protein [Sorangium sp. So ce385]|uniref:DUF6531 domain-containing protein n=1 Tax=Sorangium sp. So ce385 TaxID=3133308 RepID=UPI003F5B95FA